MLSDYTRKNKKQYLTILKMRKKQIITYAVLIITIQLQS